MCEKNPRANKGYCLMEKFCILVLCTLALSSCNVRIKPPPPTGPCMFLITGLFPNCHNPLSSTKTLTYNLVFTVYYYNGSDRETLDQQTITSGSASSTNIHSKVPSNGTNWSVEVVATATQCSVCALTQYGTDICNQTAGPGGTTAAKPVLHFWPAETVVYTSTKTIALTLNNRAENVANSCGCIVPN